MFKDFFSEPYRPDFKSNTWVFLKNKLENSWLKIKPATFKVAGSSEPYRPDFKSNVNFFWKFEKKFIIKIMRG